MNPEPRMVTVSQLAKKWGVSRSGAWNYIRRGQLSKGIRGRQGYLYPEDTPKPEPRARDKRGRYSHPAQIQFNYSWATWPAPERAP